MQKGQKEKGAFSDLSRQSPSETRVKISAGNSPGCEQRFEFTTHFTLQAGLACNTLTAGEHLSARNPMSSKEGKQTRRERASQRQTQRKNIRGSCLPGTANAKSNTDARVRQETNFGTHAALQDIDLPKSPLTSRRCVVSVCVCLPVSSVCL